MAKAMGPSTRFRPMATRLFRLHKRPGRRGRSAARPRSLEPNPSRVINPFTNSLRSLGSRSPPCVCRTWLPPFFGETARSVLGGLLGVSPLPDDRGHQVDHENIAIGERLKWQPEHEQRVKNSGDYHELGTRSKAQPTLHSCNATPDRQS